MGMETELILLAALIVVFIASFCGLLQKIRKSYENERALAERSNNNSSPRISFSEFFINPAYTTDGGNNENFSNCQGVFPSAPPPYTEVDCEPPPKYEDIFKEQVVRTTQSNTANTTTTSSVSIGN